MKSYFNLKYLSVKEAVNFGLDPGNATIKKYLLVECVHYHFNMEQPALPLVIIC